MENSKEQKEMEMKVRLFDEELQALQKKYKFKLVAQHVWPAAPNTQPAVTTIPLIVVPIIDDIQSKGQEFKSDLVNPTK